MGLEWNDSYAVGIEAIDREHRELFKHISKLIDALHQSKGTEEVAATLRFLALYADSHFAMEESLMAAHRYPGAADHAKEHAHFRATFSVLAARLQSEGPSAALAMEVNNKICNWLVRHVLGTDQPLAAHLRGKGLT